MNNLIIKQFNIGGQAVPVVDSREVAEMVEKEHSNLMRDIRGYVSILENSKLNSQNFFIKDTYKVEGNNKTYDCFLLTRKGCDMVANKMSGKKGVLFTAEYVTRFEEMEKSLKGQPLKLTTEQMLELQFKYAKEVKEEVQELKEDFHDFKGNSPLFNIECKELQALVRKIGISVLGGKGSIAYKDNSLRGKVYADIQHQLKREFGVTRYEAIKRCQLNKAIDIVSNYKVPLVLGDEIIKLNNQIHWREVI
ncbi:MAG: ORF6C domain-containing protein [Clostridium sp.]|uniref:ORF6C domain-containing protein n=1 Tax=Clostridium TaxID=1485 RepID=UPI002902731B|nr:ORF6C domain-containing protein [Clostridium sp.]MDU2156539.1 ORF6C domain-containing protein [Clostridium sp.]MDU7085896.1 ORF6C domain-containing protein [Clostridium sp.]